MAKLLLPSSSDDIAVDTSFVGLVLSRGKQLQFVSFSVLKKNHQDEIAQA